MAFLFGSSGSISKSVYIKKLSKKLIDQKTNLNVMPFEQGIIMAGYNHDEKFHYDDIKCLTDDQGIIVGKLFDHNSNSVQLNNTQSKMMLKDPKSICKNFWGRYIGVLVNKEQKKITLIRDPQGFSTIFYVIKDDGIIFSSDLSFVYDAMELKPEIDLGYFAEFMLNKNYALPTTPFLDIKELLPGMGLTLPLNGNPSLDLLWEVSHIKSSCILDKNKVEEKLLATIKMCTKAWVKDTPGVCVELSGGTDSSGVLIVLRDMIPDKKIIAVNYIDSKISSSNEIDYAQEVADSCDTPLYFIDWQNSSLFDNLPKNFLPNKPCTIYCFYNNQQQLHELAWEHNCPEIMNGQGGDHIFLSPPPLDALADYWLEQGFSGIIQPLRGLSSTYRMPWMEIIRKNGKAILDYYKKSNTSYNKPNQILDKDFVQELKQNDFYLNKKLEKFYPAKREQICTIYDAVNYCQRNQTIPGITVTHPLLSQPIVELGLKIPTYQSFDDNYDRIFFRRAIDRIKKSRCLWRRIKGQTTSTMIKSFARHAKDIKDIVLSGRLAKNGMINKKCFDEYMIKIHHGKADNLWPVMNLLVSQLWLNQWNL